MEPLFPTVRITMHNVYLRFEYRAYDKTSATFGPYAYIQLTYGNIHAQPADETQDIEEDIAGWDSIRHLWEAKDGHFYSDVIFFGENTVTPLT